MGVTAKLSAEYGYEVGGNIYQSGDHWRYTIPKIGDQSSASVNTGFIGYHTHPSGSLMFSNRFSAFGGGPGDANWVETSGKDLYLGIYNGSGVSIGVCSPGSCPDIGRLGTSPSRVVQP